MEPDRCKILNTKRTENKHKKDIGREGILVKVIDLINGLSKI
jgi:hypothetical protein